MAGEVDENGVVAEDLMVLSKVVQSSDDGPASGSLVEKDLDAVSWDAKFVEHPVSHFLRVRNGML